MKLYLQPIYQSLCLHFQILLKLFVIHNNIFISHYSIINIFTHIYDRSANGNKDVILNSVATVPITTLSFYTNNNTLLEN